LALLRKSMSKNMALLKNFTINGDIYCPYTFGWHTEPDPDCDCEWERTRDEPEYGHWTCKKCGAKFGLDVWD